MRRMSCRVRRRQWRKRKRMTRSGERAGAVEKAAVVVFGEVWGGGDEL